MEYQQVLTSNFNNAPSCAGSFQSNIPANLSHNLPFDLFKLSPDQLINLKNLSQLQKASQNMHSVICNVCYRNFTTFQAMRVHQGQTHFNILKQYKETYGKVFETVINQ